jgi:photosystem II stability/assembly factor-like uncharacterized protein
VEIFAMIDFDPFERRLAGALRADADLSVAPFDPASVARAAIQANHKRPGHNARRLRDSRVPRRTWLLVAAILLIGAGVIGTSLVGGRLVAPSPSPVINTVIADASASPASSPTNATAALPARTGQFDDMCDFGLGSTTVGWISTTTALYRTEDLGKTWSAVQAPGWSAATAVANLFIDADTAYSFLQGSPSKIAATHDGGATWVETALGEATDWPAFSFQTPSRGSLIFYGELKTDPVRIYATVDGGSTWADPRSVTTVWGAIMPDWCLHRDPSGTLGQTHPWLDRQPLNGFVQLSRDAGLTWTKRPIPAGNDPDLWGDDSGRIVLAVHPEGPPPVHDRIYTSGDDGRSWRLAADLSPGGRNVQVLSASEWILVADDGSSVASTVDGGAHWGTVVGSLTFNIGSSSFASPDVGWAVPLCGPHEYPPTHPACDPTGVKHLLLQTTDGGRTWTPVGE